MEEQQRDAVRAKERHMGKSYKILTRKKFIADHSQNQHDPSWALVERPIKEGR